MMGRLELPVLGLLSLITWTSTSAAQERTCSALLAPSSVSLRDTGFDRPRAACGADSMAMGARAFALIDTAGFYGSVSASLILDYQYLHSSGFEFGIGARLADFRFAQTGAFKADELSAGPIHVSALRPSKRRWFGNEVVLSHGLGVNIPWTNSGNDNFTLSVTPSVMSTMFLSPKLHVHGRVAVLLWSVLPEAGADGRAALLGSSDVGYAPLSFASLIAGAQVQGGWYGLGLDHVQVRGGLRVAVSEKGALELSAGSVVAGRERADLVVWLGYRRSISAKTKSKPSGLKEWAR